MNNIYRNANVSLTLAHLSDYDAAIKQEDANAKTIYEGLKKQAVTSKLLEHAGQVAVAKKQYLRAAKFFSEALKRVPGTITKKAGTIDNMVQEQVDRSQQRRMTYLRAMPYADAVKPRVDIGAKVAEKKIDKKELPEDKGTGEQSSQPDKWMIGRTVKEQNQVKKANSLTADTTKLPETTPYQSTHKSSPVPIATGTGIISGMAMHELRKRKLNRVVQPYEEAARKYEAWDKANPVLKDIKDVITEKKLNLRMHNAGLPIDAATTAFEKLKKTKVLGAALGGMALGTGMHYLLNRQEKTAASTAIVKSTFKRVAPKIEAAWHEKQYGWNPIARIVSETKKNEKSSRVHRAYSAANE